MKVIAHMVVGEGEADRYLEQTLERVTWWADITHVVLDSPASDNEIKIVGKWADSWQHSNYTWADHEGEFRQNAWNLMEANTEPEPNDFIAVIDADETVVQHDTIQRAAREHGGKRIGFRFHEMWSATHYRIDGHWKPYNGYVMIPYRPHGQFKNRRIASGREPTYAANIPTIGNPIADLLHYGYADDADKGWKYTRYMALDGGRFHNLAHIQSIIRPATLKLWDKGGTLRV